MINNINIKYPDPEKRTIDYQLLRRYYANNYLYDDLNTLSHINEKYLEFKKNYFNPAHRSVEFFASKLLPGKSLQINSSNQAVRDAILQVHKWSNLDALKNGLSRSFALNGDLFVKIVNDSKKVYFESIDPDCIDFKADKRGFLTEATLEIPSIDDEGKPYTYVEFWDKENGYMCSWNLRDKVNFKKVEELGTPDFYATLQELGIFFIPIVHAKFSDTGADLRGKSCFEHVIEKIDLINRSETRLHEMFYNFGKDFFVMIPIPKEDKNGKEAVTNIDPNLEVKIEKDGIFVVPESYSLESLTIDAKFDAGLAILNAVKMEVEKDLPEIKYFNLDGQVSGKAIKTLLSSAVDRAEEAQASLIAALIRADEIALTIGNYHNIFMGIGSYESGTFEHSLVVGEMFPMSIDEKALAINALTTAGLSLESVLKLLNFTEDEIATMVASAQAEAKLKSPMQNFSY